MDPNIVIKQEREDQSLDMTIGESRFSTLQQPIASEGISNTSISNAAIPQRTLSTANLTLDIKPNVHNLDIKEEEDDDGQITPPIPRLVKFPAIETQSIAKDKEDNVGVPIREVDQISNVPNTSANIGASISVPNIVAAFWKEDAVNEIISLELARDLQRQLDVTRYDFQQFRKKSISAANLVQSNNHENEYGPNMNNLEQHHTSVFPSTTQPIQLREEESQTEFQQEAIENMARVAYNPISESTATQLNAKLQLVEKNALESFKKIEVRQTSMLEEIKKTNENLEKLLRSVSSTGSSEVEIWMPALPALNDQRSSDDDIDYFIALPANELNLRDEWVEKKNDEDSDEGDYEMMASEYHPVPVDRGNYNDVLNYPHKQRANTDAISPTEFVHQRDESTTGYVCTCGSKFRLLTTLGDHILYKNLPKFKCDLCIKKFFKRRDLITHVRNAHKIIVHDDRFVCFSCNSRFTSCLEMFNHKRSCPVLNARTNKGNKLKYRTSSVSSSMEDLMNHPV